MKITERVFKSVAILIAAAALWIPAAAIGQEIIVEPPFRPPIAWIEGVTVDEHQVNVTLEGPIAHVEVSQLFHNSSNAVVEGVYVFPLPTDAAVGDFQMTVDGQVIEGKLMSASQARGIYEETVRQMRDPALLEYVGRGLFQTSVFPIPPGETRTIKLTYGQVVESADGLYRFTYPLWTPGARSPAKRTTLHAEITSTEGLRAVYSPTHDVRIVRPDALRAIVDYATHGPVQAGQGPEGRRGFSLYYGESSRSVELNLLGYKPAGDDGYFLMLVAPTVEVPETDVVRRDVVVVLDVSGSMEGDKLVQAKEALAYVIERLNPGDRFNVIAFSTGVSLWSDRLQDATPEAMEAARVWIDRLAASGSTDINRALLEALYQLQSRTEAPLPVGYVLFMTDGLPTQGETNPVQIVENATANMPSAATVRLFTFGVGYDVNTDLLDTLSRRLGGRSSYVRPEEAIQEAVGSFYAKVQTPVLTNVNFEFDEGVTPGEVYPDPLPDLFAGEQLVVTGRYRSGGDTDVTLTGYVNGERVQYVYEGRKLVNAGGEPFVARLWATRKVGVLLDEVRRSGPNPELIDAIVDLSLQYGIMTPYTSYLVEEPTVAGDFAPEGQAMMDLEPQAMEQAARDSIAMGAAEAAAAPASGEQAVVASQDRARMQSASVVQEEAEVRYVGGRAFVQQGTITLADGRRVEFWVDTAYQADMRLETISFASERYFELLSDPAMAEILAISTELVIVTGDQAIRITATEGEVEAYPAPATVGPDRENDGQGGAEDVEGEGAWDGFLRWLFGR